MYADEDQKHRVGYFAGLVVSCIQPEVDNAPQHLTTNAVREPISETLSTIPRLGITYGDGGLGHPKDASRDATPASTQKREPAGAESVVGIETSSIRGKPEAVF